MKGDLFMTHGFSCELNSFSAKRTENKEIRTYLTYQIHPRSHPIPFPTFLSPPTRSYQPKGHRYDDRPYPR